MISRIPDRRRSKKVLPGFSYNVRESRQDFFLFSFFYEKTAFFTASTGMSVPVQIRKEAAP